MFTYLEVITVTLLLLLTPAVKSCGVQVLDGINLRLWRWIYKTILYLAVQMIFINTVLMGNVFGIDLLHLTLIIRLRLL